jgi:hypothetical protein
VVLPDRGQAEGPVLLGVLLAARTEETQVDQAYRSRQDPFPGQPPSVQMVTDDLAYRRQDGPELLNPFMLVLVPLLAPQIVVPVLAAPGRGSLQIQTSCQAGGITRALIRARVRGSLTVAASAPR